MKITSDVIKKALENKHKNDIFVSECKNGATHKSNELLIFDAWTAKRSWEHPCTTIYEIKVDRSDFLNDEKWMKYLRYCHEFYFVCPKGLISPTELPAEVGLYYISDTGNVLYCKKKAVYREMPEADSVLMYILMCRATISRDKTDKKRYWEEWLQAKELDYKFGREVGEKIRATIAQKIDFVEHENRALKREMHKYDRIKEALRNLGFSEDDVGMWSFEKNVIKKVNDLNGYSAFAEDIEEIILKLQKIISSIKR